MLMIKGLRPVMSFDRSDSIGLRTESELTMNGLES